MVEDQTTAATMAMRATTLLPITTVFAGISPSGKASLFRAFSKDPRGCAAERRHGGVAAWKREADTEKQSFSARRVRENPGETTIFVYDAAGKLAPSTPTPKRSHPSSGRRGAEYSTVVAAAEDARVAYLTADHLGSPRINTDRDGKVTSRHDYHPYGEEIITAQRTSHEEYTPDSVRKQFTGYERDDETDLDFAQARHYKSQHGRFTSTDPILIK